MPPETADDTRWKMALEKLEALSNDLREYRRTVTSALMQLDARQYEDKAERKERQKTLDQNFAAWEHRLETIEHTLATWLRHAAPWLVIAIIILVLALVVLAGLTVIRNV